MHSTTYGDDVLCIGAQPVTAGRPDVTVQLSD